MSDLTSYPCLARKGRHLYRIGACPHCEAKRLRSEVATLEASRQQIFKAADIEIEQLRAELAASRHELVGAKKSARAQARIIESLQQQRAHLHVQRDQWIEARNTLDSERAANARLTEELAASREREARMRAKLEYALQQNDLDMLLTGDEIRDCRAALAEGAQG